MRLEFPVYYCNHSLSKQMVRKLMVNIILDYLQNTVHNQYTITANVRGGVLPEKYSKTFLKNP